MRRCAALFACLLALAACGGDDDDDTSVDASTGSDAAAPDAAGCADRVPRPANGSRFAVVSHPYDADGNPSGAYEVLELSAAGELSRTGTTFEMSRSFLGTVQFTPDGEVGVVAQDDGSLGVFRIDDTGAVQVVHAAYEGEFYAESVVPAGGSHMYVIDPNWRKNGGGIYEITIGCDGAITGERLVTAAKAPHGLSLLPGGAAVVWSSDVLASPADKDAHLVNLSGDPSLLDSVDAFPDDEAILGSFALTADGRFALGGDTSQFSGVDNRVAIVEVSGTTLTPRQVLTPIEDPIDIATSPFGDTAIVASGFGDAVFVLDYAAGDTPPFALRGELGYVGASPQLPGKLVMIDRGDLRGLVLLAENVGVRRIRFEGGGTVTDLGEFNFGSGLDNISGTIGVQP